MKLTASQVRSISEPGKYVDQHGERSDLLDARRKVMDDWSECLSST